MLISSHRVAVREPSSWALAPETRGLRLRSRLDFVDRFHPGDDNTDALYLGIARPERSDRAFAAFAERVMAMADQDDETIRGQSKSVERMEGE